MIKNKLTIGLLFILTLGIVSCAPEGYEHEKAGFFSGIWHGFIIVFSLIGKVIGRDIGLYAEHNTGFGYWIGFLIGLGGFGGGSNSAR